MRLIDADALLEDVRNNYEGVEYWRIIERITNAPTVQVDILNITKVLEGYKAPEPLPVIPLTHEQLNTPFGTSRTVQREGWVSVPIEPAEEMIDAAFVFLKDGGVENIDGDDIRGAIRYAIQAAPTDTE